MTKKEREKEHLLIIESLLKWAENGNKLVSYICPHCEKRVCTRKPNKKDVSSKGYWDSATSCYKCNKTSFIIVYPSGKIGVKKLGR